MTSYASVDRIEGVFAVCEVELIPFEESKPEDFKTKDTAMMDVPLREFSAIFGDVNQGDVWIVKHDNENVNLVYYKDEEEMARRIEVLSQISRR